MLYYALNNLYLFSKFCSVLHLQIISIDLTWYFNAEKEPHIGTSIATTSYVHIVIFILLHSLTVILPAIFIKIIATNQLLPLKHV